MIEGREGKEKGERRKEEKKKRRKEVDTKVCSDRRWVDGLTSAGNLDGIQRTCPRTDSPQQG